MNGFIMAGSNSGLFLAENWLTSVKIHFLTLRGSELVVNLEQSQKIYCCRHSVYPPQAELPVLPKCTISKLASLRTCEMQAKGIPRNKDRELFFRDSQLKGQTLYAHIFDLSSLYLKPMEEAIEQRMSKNNAVLMDKTNYQFCGSKVKGRCHPTDNLTDYKCLI